MNAFTDYMLIMWLARVTSRFRNYSTRKSRIQIESKRIRYFVSAHCEAVSYSLCLNPALWRFLRATTCSLCSAISLSI